MPSGLTIVKFGGSLTEAPERDALLAAASRAGAIVVPGGGAFADAVRGAQARTRFSDAAAHSMAILAMDQTAVALADAAPAMPLCATRAGLDGAAARGRGAIWRPSPMALGAELPTSWDVTSDSLAIWLAIELGAARLVILKSANVAPGASLESLSAAGVVDPYAPGLARRFCGEISVIGPATAPDLDDALSNAGRRAA